MNSKIEEITTLIGIQNQKLKPIIAFRANCTKTGNNGNPGWSIHFSFYKIKFFLSHLEKYRIQYWWGLQ